MFNLSMYINYTYMTFLHTLRVALKEKEKKNCLFLKFNNYMCLDSATWFIIFHEVIRIHVKLQKQQRSLFKSCK